jgi:carbonic anhydrase
VTASKTSGERTSKNAAFVQTVAETNVRMGMAALTAKSPVIKGLVKAGQLRIAGAMQDLPTGRVSFWHNSRTWRPEKIPAAMISGSHRKWRGVIAFNNIEG